MKINLKMYIAIFSLLLLQSVRAKAQNKEMYKLFDQLISIDHSVFISDNNFFYNKSVAFSITINVNNLGLVDTVSYSSSGDKDLPRLFDFNKITAGLKANKTAFKLNKNEILVLLVMYIRGDEIFPEIDNGNQFIANWLAIIKKSNYIENTKRRQIFLTPMVLYTKGKMIKD